MLASTFSLCSSFRGQTRRTQQELPHVLFLFCDKKCPVVSLESDSRSEFVFVFTSGSEEKCRFLCLLLSRGARVFRPNVKRCDRQHSPGVGSGSDPRVYSSFVSSCLNDCSS